jgi:hypothetical protein
VELEGAFEGREGLGEFADRQRLAFGDGGLEAGFELGDGAFGHGDEFAEELGGDGGDGGGFGVHGGPLLACDGERLRRAGE